MEMTNVELEQLKKMIKLLKLVSELLAALEKSKALSIYSTNFTSNILPKEENELLTDCFLIIEENIEMFQDMISFERNVITEYLHQNFPITKISVVSNN